MWDTNSHRFFIQAVVLDFLSLQSLSGFVRDLQNQVSQPGRALSSPASLRCSPWRKEGSVLPTDHPIHIQGSGNFLGSLFRPWPQGQLKEIFCSHCRHNQQHLPPALSIPTCFPPSYLHPQVPPLSIFWDQFFLFALVRMHRCPVPQSSKFPLVFQNSLPTFLTPVFPHTCF